MQIPPSVRTRAVEAVISTGFRLFEGWLGTIQIHKPPSPQDDSKPCTTCLIHQHIILARGYVEGTYSRLNKDGSIPAGLGGPIEQARQHLKEAMTEIPEVIGSHPMIDSACKQLGELLPDITARLEHIDSEEEWQVVLNKLHAAETVSYAIPEAMFRREFPKAEEEEGKVVILTASQQRLIELASKAKDGDKDARAELAKLYER